MATFSQGLDCLLLQAQGNFFFFVIDVQNDHVEFFVDLHHFRGVTDSSPAHVGNVEQSVDPSQVDKGAKIGDVFDNALALLADFEFFQQLGFFLGPLSFDKLRRLTTMLRRASSIFSTMHSIVLPMYSPISWGRRMST